MVMEWRDGLSGRERVGRRNSSLRTQAATDTMSEATYMEEAHELEALLNPPLSATTAPGELVRIQRRFQTVVRVPFGCAPLDMVVWWR